MSTDDSNRKVALITGASAGLGLAIARRFAEAGFDLAIVGRDVDRLKEAAGKIHGDGAVECIACDVTEQEEVERLLTSVSDKFERLDVLVNNVGLSDRGVTRSLEIERLTELLKANVFTALLCSQISMPLLENSRGQIINIGSLAAKVAPRYLGGYAAAKHSLAAVTQQLRLESREVGVNVMLVSPGPIRRGDAGERYKDKVTEGMPDSANKPAGGTKVKGLAPEYVADRIYRAYCRRSVDVMLPGYLRPIVALGHLFPSLGDRMLLWFTKTKD